MSSRAELNFTYVILGGAEYGLDHRQFSTVEGQEGRVETRRSCFDSRKLAMIEARIPARTQNYIRKFNSAR